MSCCTPSESPGGTGRITGRSGSDEADAVALPVGTFAMGEETAWSYSADGEGPVRQVQVEAFTLDAHAVTNERFAAFVDDTGFVTDAERIGWSFVFAGLLPEDFPDTRGVAAAPWWRHVHGATWRTPEGPHSTARSNHPVVQVSGHDAAAFAAWAGKRLPTEAEWEYAARAGSSSTFPWGDELEPSGVPQANTWNGDFPTSSTDGTCAVDAYGPNAFGLWNMIGNVWEWTADLEAGQQLLKGGSYLCHASYCRRYRPAARSRATADSSLGNTGFRCAS